MENTFFLPLPPLTEDGDPGVFVQGVHVPTDLVQKSGIWVHRAGSAMLLQSAYQLSIPDEAFVLIVDEGRVNLEYGTNHYVLNRGECMVLPPNATGCTLSRAKDARLLWMTLAGPLCPDVLQKMNASSRFPIRQGVLPTQILLVRQIVQVLVRHSESEDASYQLAQLLWGIIAAHSGQSVAMMATLSHEIARVVDTLRANQYHDAFSLAEMAAISRMPVETFRKRFSAELGIPPLCYLQFLKMERAKTLLRGGKNVRQTGVEVGMPDPYHFSKQFKHVVGMSPTAYLKHVGGIDGQSA
jgi:AraC-like DNA-binding protein